MTHPNDRPIDELRLELVVERSMRHVTHQPKRLKGRDKKALQEEWLEFSALQWDDLDIQWMQDYRMWED